MSAENSSRKPAAREPNAKKAYGDRDVHDSIDQLAIDPANPVIIVTNPERLGGTPCFVGTRVPVAVFFENLADGLTIDEIVDQYPSVTKDVAIETLRQANVVLNRAAVPVLD